MHYTTQHAMNGAVDRLEINVMGKWKKNARHNITKLELGSCRLGEKQVEICQGGKDGPDFYDVSLLIQNMYRIHIYKNPTNKAAVRVSCFSGMTAKYGAHRSRLIVMRFLKNLGFIWEIDKLSRLDLCVDIDVDFDEFEFQISWDRIVCRANYINSWEHPTTIYIGRPQSIQAKIYDKGLEEGGDNVKTRIEFMLRRRWLREHNLNHLEHIDLNRLWKYLTSKWLRITQRLPDGKHYDQLGLWHVWKQLQKYEGFTKSSDAP